MRACVSLGYIWSWPRAQLLLVSSLSKNACQIPFSSVGLLTLGTNRFALTRSWPANETLSPKASETRHRSITNGKTEKDGRSQVQRTGPSASPIPLPSRSLWRFAPALLVQPARTMPSSMHPRSVGSYEHKKILHATAAIYCRRQMCHQIAIKNRKAFLSWST